MTAPQPHPAPAGFPDAPVFLPTGDQKTTAASDFSPDAAGFSNSQAAAFSSVLNNQPGVAPANPGTSSAAARLPARPTSLAGDAGRGLFPFQRLRVSNA